MKDLRRAVVAALSDLQQAGVVVLPRPRSKSTASAMTTEPALALSHPTDQPSEPIARPGSPEAEAASRPSSSGVLFDMPASHSRPAASSAAPAEARSTAPTLEILSGEVAACTRCAELAASRTQTVFADGNPNARLVFLGEAPGADEDRQGKPFVGRAGKLLTDVIEKGMKVRRDDVYIMNVLKCRPPGNRTPLPHEVHSCRPFLLRQLELVDPEFVCCLGAVAAQNLLQTTQSIGKLRGRFFDLDGMRVMCTYHPAYLLRNPAAKRQTWEDIQMLMQAMELA